MNLKTKNWSKGSFEQKTFLREWERRKARVFKKKRECCVNPSICSRSCKKEEGKRLGLQVQRDFKVCEQTLGFLLLMFGLKKP